MAATDRPPSISARALECSPWIYELVCQEFGVAPSDAAFLDDIGRNLKPARALGMTTLKVDDPDEALAELEELLGFRLLGDG